MHIKKYTTADPSVPPTEEQMQIVNAALNVVVPTNVDSLKPGLFSGYKGGFCRGSRADSGNDAGYQDQLYCIKWCKKKLNRLRLPVVTPLRMFRSSRLVKSEIMHLGLWRKSIQPMVMLQRRRIVTHLNR